MLASKNGGDVFVFRKRRLDPDFFPRGGVGVELLAVNSQMKVYWKTSSQVPAYQYKYVHASLAIPFSHKNRKDLM